MTPEILMSVVSAKGLSIDHTHCFARDDSQRASLTGALRKAVWYDDNSIAVREHWPLWIRGQKYRERLVRLAVLEERYGFVIRPHRLWPDLMAADGFKGMDEELWERQLSTKYELVRSLIREVGSPHAQRIHVPLRPHNSTGDQDMTEHEEIDTDSYTGKDGKRILVLLMMLSATLWLFAGVKVFAGTAKLTCTAPTQNTDGSNLTDLAGIRWLYGTSSSALTATKDTSTCAATIDSLAAGTWYFAAKAFATAGTESALSNVVSKTIATATPGSPTVQSLKVTETTVYNTGTFDPAKWLVKRNKTYGTVPLGTLCDETKPATDSYYRVPASSVKWTNSNARTSYPLAKCALQ